MADGLTTTTTVATIPSGTTIATDDVAGTHYEVIKLADGTADSATRIASGVGTPVSALRVVEATAATSTLANVAGSATSVTLQASNANRLGWTVFNDSTAILYVKCGATASTTSFTVKMAAGAYWELPFRYTGVVDGIWASATGNARVTEFTA